MDEVNNLHGNDREDLEEESGQKMSLIARLAGIFLDPKKTFLSLEPRPDFIVPLILTVLVVFACTWAAWPVIETSSLEMMQEKLTDRGMDQDQIDQFLENQQKFGKVSGLAGGPVSTVLIAFIVAGILLFAGNMVLGGDSVYKKMLCVYSYASLVGIIGHLVRTILIISKGSIQVYTSLAALFPLDMKDTWFLKLPVFSMFSPSGRSSSLPSAWASCTGWITKNR